MNIKEISARVVFILGFFGIPALLFIAGPKLPTLIFIILFLIFLFVCILLVTTNPAQSFKKNLQAAFYTFMTFLFFAMLILLISFSL